MSLTTSDVIIIVISTILSLITVLLVLWEAEEQMFVFGLRPSESISSDIGGLITLSRGLTGNIKMSYGNTTSEIEYKITIKNKLVCVTATSRYTSTDCSSSAFNVPNTKSIDGNGFKLLIEKTDDNVDVELEA